MKREIKITVIHCEDNEKIKGIDIKSEASAFDTMVGSARLLALTEFKLPEELRAQFRADFLEILNIAREEAIGKAIENGKFML